MGVRSLGWDRMTPTATAETAAARPFVVVGAGGLGCPALLGLVSAGARRLTIIDDDEVDASNLHRQVLYSLADVGRRKVDAAAWTLARLAGPEPRELAIDRQPRRLAVDDPESFVALLDPEAIVLECSDGPELKFAIHDACVAAGVPVVVGGVVGWTGQAMAIDPARRARACYRCLFEGPPPRALAPACAAVGVMGSVAGVVGHAMASLALELATNQADSPAGRMLSFDLLGGRCIHLEPGATVGCTSSHHRDATSSTPARTGDWTD